MDYVNPKIDQSSIFLIAKIENKLCVIFYNNQNKYPTGGWKVVDVGCGRRKLVGVGSGKFV